jgi:transposase
MGKVTRFVGLDVHASTVAVAVAEGRQQVRSVGTVDNRAESVARMLQKLGRPEDLKVCYEAGPTGYALYWQLTELGFECEVIAPSLAPCKPGDRVKTDRRDAERLARSYQAGDLTVVWVPDSRHEALRDLVRLRAAGKEDEKRAKHRLGKFLLRYGQRPSTDCRSWSAAWWQWVRRLALPHPEQNATLLELIGEVDHQETRVARVERQIDEAVERAPERLREVIAALQSLRGIARETATVLAVEFGSFERFERAAQVMSYTGLVSSEHSSGGKKRQGAITKTGNSHLRRALVEAAWHYRHRPRTNQRRQKLLPTLPAKIVEMAETAQARLHRRYWALTNKSKPSTKVVTAVARELAGFVWAIGQAAEQLHREKTASEPSASLQARPSPLTSRAVPRRSSSTRASSLRSAPKAPLVNASTT